MTGQYKLKLHFKNLNDFIWSIPESVINPEKDEQSLIDRELFWWLEGNGSCDCNRILFSNRENNLPEVDTTCGDTIELVSITLIRPDTTEKIIYQA